jgi:signal transduction histidine kinase
MPVEISNILHVLAHELRTPVGIAHGYVRLLLDDRLPQETDRRRALEQMQKALARLSELSHESTALAAWYERDTAPEQKHSIDARTLIDRVGSAEFASPVEIDAEAVDAAARIRTLDVDALVDALVNAVRATARELRAQTCIVKARVADGRHFELLTGAADQLAPLRTGPDGEGASAIALERGGLGLALVHAAAVLDAHGAQRWTVKGSRQVLGIRLPLERPLQ